MSVRRRTLDTLALLATALLAACGSTPSSSGTPPPLGDAPVAGDAIAQQPAGALGTAPGGAPGAAQPRAAGAAPAQAPATPYATQIPFATPESPSGHATVHTISTGDFTETGSTCDAAGDAAVFEFGYPGSAEEVTVSIHTGYTGPGTYTAPSADAYVSASHHGHTWYAQFSSSKGASITVDSGGRSGSFAFTDQVDTRERVTGVFACG